MITFLRTFFLLVCVCVASYADDQLSSLQHRFYKGEYITVSDQLLARSASLEPTEELLLCYSLYKLKRFDEAEQRLKKVHVRDYFLKLCQRYLMYLIVFQRDPAEADVFFTKSRLFRDPFFADYVFVAKAGYYLKERDKEAFDSMRARLKVLEKTTALQPYVNELFFSYACMTRKRSKASRVLRGLMEKYPVFSRDRQLVEHYNTTFKKSFELLKELKTDRKKVRRLEKLYTQEEYDQLILEGNEMISLIERSSERGKVYYWMGNAFYNQLNYFRAQEMYKRALSLKLPKKILLESYYKRGECYFHLKDYSLAFEPWNVLLDQFPNSEWVPRIYYWLLKYFKVSDKADLYTEYLAGMQKRYPQSPEYKRLVWNQNWHNQASNQSIHTYEDAKQWLQTQVGPGPLYEFLIYYYQRLMQFYQFRTYKDVILRYPITYDLHENLKVVFEYKMITKRPEDSYLQVHQAYMSGFLNLFDVYNRVSQQRKRRYPWAQEKQMMVYAYQSEFSDAFDIFDHMIQTHPKKMSYYALQHFSPDVGLKEIDSFSKRYKVNPFWMNAIIKQASAFDYRLVDDNRYGLFQLTQSSINKINQRYGLGRVDNNRKIDFSTNIQMGTVYFSWLMKEFDHIPHYALYSYLMGPLFTKKLIKARGKNPSLIAFSDRTLFPSVRDFLAKTNRNLVFYYLREYAEKMNLLDPEEVSGRAVP